MNPVTIRLLITADQKANAKGAAEEWRTRLLDWKIPTVEEALVVMPLSRPAKRASRKRNETAARRGESVLKCVQIFGRIFYEHSYNSPNASPRSRNPSPGPTPWSRAGS